jgi:hypothetical protein
MAPGIRMRLSSRRFWRWLPVLVPIAVVVFLLVGFWDWIPTSISGQVPVFGGGPCYASPAQCEGFQISFPSGQIVTVHWVDESGGVVEFQVFARGPVVGPVPQCDENGSSGGCSFTSVANYYTFSAYMSATEGGQLVNFTASYLRSML